VELYQMSWVYSVYIVYNVYNVCCL
jgi:hypothetical protein